MYAANKLVKTNVHWLQQALVLVESLEDATYSTPPDDFPAHRAGAHLRHVLEFYQCFLEGLDSGHIDYDARRRNTDVECSRQEAARAIRSIVAALETRADLRVERIVRVRIEDAGSTCDPFMGSSISRELQVLSSHTVHHFALIAMTLRAHGVRLDPAFGMAPSTLRYLAAKAAEAA